MEEGHTGVGTALNPAPCHTLGESSRHKRIIAPPERFWDSDKAVCNLISYVVVLEVVKHYKVFITALSPAIVQRSYKKFYGRWAV